MLLNMSQYLTSPEINIPYQLKAAIQPSVVFDRLKINCQRTFLQTVVPSLNLLDQHPCSEPSCSLIFFICMYRRLDTILV